MSAENPASLPEIQALLAEPGLFSALDRQFGLFMARLAKNHKPAAALAGGLVSRSTAEGHICLDLDALAGSPLSPANPENNMTGFVCPPLADWIKQLLESGVVGRDRDTTPLVLVGSRLYLRRYREYELGLVRFIRQRAEEVYRDLDYDRLDRDLKRLFSPSPGSGPDWQQIGAIAAVSRSFCIISGGPGTGKTTTVARILALLISQYRDRDPLRILLAAPTGKAAARLQQAIADSNLLPPGTKPVAAATLHRLLGHIPNSPYFRHNRENPLEADVIVIDEASMIDLPLMAKLMQAVPAGARLMLLGDRYQLASVQPGSVLGDLCPSKIMAGFSPGFRENIAELTGSTLPRTAAAAETDTAPGLQDSFIELTRSYRFEPESSIARLGRAIKDGDGDRALALLLDPGDDSTVWAEVPDAAGLDRALRNSDLVGQYRMMQAASEPDACFRLLDDFRLLCGLRQGPFGADRINHLLEQLLAEPAPADSPLGHAGRSVEGRPFLPVHPVMINRNDYQQQLFNGDVGIIMAEPRNPRAVRAFFKADYGTLRAIGPALLPEHETVFAMTVHKSQGSEFNRVLLVLPDRDSPLLTRELLYTAITRARQKVEIWGRQEIFAAAVGRRIKRSSGLRPELWGPESVTDSGY